MISAERAEAATIRTLQKSGPLDRFFPSRRRSVTVEAVRTAYFPYWIAVVDHEISLTGGHFGMIVALDGLGGEAGIAFGCPDFSNRPPAGACVVANRFPEDEARRRLYEYARVQYSRKRKVLPRTTLVRLESVAMPYYVVKARVVASGRSYAVTRFIDGETGVPVYRYDGMKGDLAGYPDLAAVI